MGDDYSTIIMKRAGLFFVFLLTALMQISFISALPEPLSLAFLPFALSVFITFGWSLRSGLMWGFGFGVLFDLLSSYAFGTVSFSIILSLLLSYMLFELIFTNKSIYSLILLGWIANIMYHIFFHYLNESLLLLHSTSVQSINAMRISEILMQSTITAFILAVLWHAVNITTKRFRPALLGRHEKF